MQLNLDVVLVLAVLGADTLGAAGSVELDFTPEAVTTRTKKQWVSCLVRNTYTSLFEKKREEKKKNLRGSGLVVDGHVVRVGGGVDLVDLEAVNVLLGHAAGAVEGGRLQGEGRLLADGRADVGGDADLLVGADDEADLVDGALDELVEGLELGQEDRLLGVGGRGRRGLGSRGGDGGAEESGGGGDGEAHFDELGREELIKIS